MSFPQHYLRQLHTSLETIDVAKVSEAIELFREARLAGRTIFVCGNGGSASTASHFVTDMVKGASCRDPRFRIVALTDSLSTISAYANDLSYEAVFVEQLKNFAQAGDLVMGISCSGNSPNVLRAIEYANSIGCQTLGLTGRDGGILGALCRLEIRAAAAHMGRIEDIHMIICHMISYCFMDTD